MEFGVVFWVSLITQSLVCAGFCHKLAYEKGYLHRAVIKRPEKERDESTNVVDVKFGADLVWAALGFLFGIFALIAAAGLPDRKKESQWLINEMRKT